MLEDIFFSVIKFLFVDVLGGLINWLTDSLVGQLLYFIEAKASQAIGWLYETFEIFSGIRPVTFNGQQTPLHNIFLLNTTLGGNAISYVYWSFAMVGIALAFGFAIAAVIKKTFDIDGENKLTFSKILINLLKSILIIFLMSSILMVIMNATTVLLKTVTTTFKESTSEKARTKIVTYDEEDFACMARIVDTVADYSMNPSYNSRYNINSCFNDIREDLVTLKRKGVFEYPYLMEDDKTYWQYYFQEIVNSVDISKDAPMDIYNARLSKALEDMMELLRTDKNFKPLQKYTYVIPAKEVAGEIDIARVIMVVGSLGAAKDGQYNGEGMSIMDELRAPYTMGTKNIYDADQVQVDFNIGLVVWNHVTAILLIAFMLYSFLGIGFNCAARIFNMLFLYLILPFAASTMPYDDGAKMKQWTTAFVIQSFSFFGTVIAIQLFVLMLPVVYDGALVLHADPMLNWFMKSLLIIAFGLSVSRASSILTGILAENAGMEAVRAGDLADRGRELLANSAKNTKDFFKSDNRGGGSNNNNNNAAGGKTEEKKEEGSEEGTDNLDSKVNIGEGGGGGKAATLQDVWKKGFASDSGEGGSEKAADSKESFNGNHKDLGNQKGGSKDDFNSNPKSSLHLGDPNEDTSSSQPLYDDETGFVGSSSINGDDDDDEDDEPIQPRRRSGSLSAASIQEMMARREAQEDNMDDAPEELPDSNK